MNKKRFTYYVTSLILVAASCSKDEGMKEVRQDTGTGLILVPTVGSPSFTRTQTTTTESLNSFQVTCFNPNINTEGPLAPYFENTTFRKNGQTSFQSLDTGIDWPTTTGDINFISFSPSCTSMADSCRMSTLQQGEKTYFELRNNSKIVKSTEGTQATIDYKLANLRVPKDIPQQYDFITALSKGNIISNLETGVPVLFQHQMSRIEVQVWGDHKYYEFEIAGIRLGNPNVEGTFNFEAATTQNGSQSTNGPASAGYWDETPGTQLKSKVEYIFGAGDTIVKISDNSHNSVDSPASIMGNGGLSMVIPTDNDEWEVEDLRKNWEPSQPPYKTDQMYLSVLMRITKKNNDNNSNYRLEGDIIYPYQGRFYPNKDSEGNKYKGSVSNMNVVYFLMNETTGKIYKRLYQKKESDPEYVEFLFYTDAECKNIYDWNEFYTYNDDNIALETFGWAAIPVSAKWVAGKTYVYTIDYSNGVGLHDPEDPDPGKEIYEDDAKFVVWSSKVKWGVKVNKWKDAVGYDPDIDIDFQ